MGRYDVPWLAPWEQEEAIEMMMRYGLLEFSNARDLPLKSGGFTDVYIALRNERDDPRATAEIAWLFENPLGRLRPDRIVEIPDSISGVAGVLSVATGIPRLTIRQEAKEGRVSKPKIIGHPRYGKTVWGIDDVITDGASNVPIYEECRRLGLNIPGVVVLVDRQQGWQENFAEQGIPMAVWPGMTLHDVRKWLINKRLMERCNPQMEEKNPLIVGLDGRHWKDVLRIVDPLRPLGCILKVNDLVIGEGLRVVEELSVYGRVLLDLKGHDTPGTLQNICNRILQLPVLPWGVIVHASGGEAMLKVVVEAFKGTGVKVFAVTVLTSLGDECEEIYGRLPIEEVRILAAIGVRAGVDGFICSPQEVHELSTTYADKMFLTPGIRAAGEEMGGQQRTDTAAAAWANGARGLVIGSRFANAKDPAAEVIKVLTQELGINI